MSTCISCTYETICMEPRAHTNFKIQTKAEHLKNTVYVTAITHLLSLLGDYNGSQRSMQAVTGHTPHMASCTQVLLNTTFDISTSKHHFPIYLEDDIFVVWQSFKQLLTLPT